MKIITPPYLLVACIFAIFGTIVFLPFSVTGQSTGNYYSIVAHQDRYYDSLISIRGVNNMKGTGYVSYLRWKRYWLPYLGHDGELETTQNAIFQFTNNFSTLTKQINSRDGNWQQLGPFKKPYNIPLGESDGMSGVGRIHTITFDPVNSNIVYALSPTWGGLYRSVDYGTSWTRVQTDTVEGEAMGWLLVDNTNSQVLYLANGDADGTSASGIYRSGNNGESWRKIVDLNASQRHKGIRKLVMDPNNNGRILAATGFGLYKYFNITSIHADTLNVLNKTILDIEYKPGQNDIVYACSNNSKFLYRSTNDGDTWDSIPNCPALNLIPDNIDCQTNIEFSASNPNLLFLLIQQTSNDVVLYIYNIDSQTWISHPLPGIILSNFTKGFAVSPFSADTMYAGAVNNGYPIYKSVNMGLNWVELPKIDYHVDIHHLDYSNKGHLWAGTDGGVHRLNNTGQWTDLTNMSIANIGEFDVAQSDTNFALMGCWDDGSMLLNKAHPGDNKWAYVGGGDGDVLAIDPTDATIYYTSTLQGSIVRHEPSFPTPKPLLPVSGVKSAWNSLVIDAGNHNIIYMITDSVIYRSDFRGDDGTWKCVTNNLDTDTAHRTFYRLYTSETTPGVLYLHNYVIVEDTSHKYSYCTYYRSFNADNPNVNQITWEKFVDPDAGFFTEMAFDPIDPHKGWVALQGWDSPLKVKRFDENGWHNLTYNLYNVLHVPGLAGLVYDRMSNTDRLYAGTYEGVFSLDENDTAWVLFSGMPDADIKRLKIQYLSGKLYAATWGKGVWEATIHNPCTDVIHINRDTTISHSALSFCDIMIDSLYTMTITGCLSMGPDAKIMIHQGAKLVLDGGTITGYNHQMWKGIEVWGNSSKSQSPASNQGWFKAINNAVVENAITGLATIKTARSYDYTCTGGIIQANKTTFRNCSQSIMFYPFENRNLFGSIYGNVSGFGNCTFEINNNYTGADTIKNIVSLDQVRGVDFGACIFVNSCTSALADSITGLYSYNSGFGVYSLCNSNVIPCDDTTHSEFSGLKYGIKAISSGVLKYIQIDDCLFSNNLRSVYLSGINVPEITRNTIHTKIATQTLPSCGIYLDNSTGYSLQENTITGNYNGSNTYETGIIINNSGTADNLVYNNILSFLQEGIKAQNINRSSNGITGLVCKCNDFTGNKSDEVVFLSQQNQNWGIALYQGDSLSETGPAGNTFSQRSMIKTYDLQNQGARFKYYHQPNTYNKRLKPETQFCSNVYIKQVGYTYYEPTSCPSKLSNGSGIPIEEANEYLQTINGTIEQKESELYTLVDGGNTEEITETIVNSVPPEALELRDNLLSKSPYLSDTAMQTAVSNEFVLPNVMIRDILVANPQSAGSESVLNELDKRIDPMPEDMYNQILAGESVYSPLEVKEMELAWLKLERAQLFDYLLASKMTDTTVSLIDSLTTFLQNEQTLEAKYLLATQQIYHGDTVDAFNTLESIPVDFELSPQQQTVYTEYNSYAAILKNILNDTLCGMQADSIQTVALMALVEEAHEPIKSYARNMLLSIGRVKYSEPYLYSDELKSERIKKEHKMNPSQQNDYLKIYPNPANSYIIVVYNLEKLLDEFVSTASIEISSIQGQVIKKIILDRKIDQKVVSTQLLFPGIYVVSLKVRDKTIETKKVNIIHP